MQSVRGFTLFELLVVVALIAVISATALPTLAESSRRNSVWTASEAIGTQIRQARLKAITRNQRFRVDFDCPLDGQLRVLAVQENAALDDAADRCNQTYDYDSGVYAMPEAVSFGNVPTLEVSGRGIYSSIGGAIPQTITVTYEGGAHTRSLTVSLTGQITFQ